MILGGVLLRRLALAPSSDCRGGLSCGRRGGGCRGGGVPDGKPGSRKGAGVFSGTDGSGGRCTCGVPVAVGSVSVGGLCGSGSLSDEEEDEESDDEEDEESIARRGVCSPSGSSGARLAVLAGGRCGGRRRVPASVSMGGGSSTCIWVAVLSSTAVGIAPKSTYRDPAMLF